MTRLLILGSSIAAGYKAYTFAIPKGRSIIFIINIVSYNEKEAHPWKIKVDDYGYVFLNRNGCCTEQVCNVFSLTNYSHT